MAGLEEIGVYIGLHQNIVTKYITNCPIMDLRLVADRKTGLRLSRRWWEQTDLDILGIRATNAEEERGGGERYVIVGERGKVG